MHLSNENTNSEESVEYVHKTPKLSLLSQIGKCQMYLN